MIYAIQSGDAVKIGFAKSSALSRMRELQIGSAEELKLIAVCDGEVYDEKWLHRVLSAHRIRGEWFRKSELTDAVIDTIQAGGYDHIPLWEISGLRLVASRGPNSKEVSPISPNGRKREVYNAYMREYMRARRARVPS